MWLKLSELSGFSLRSSLRLLRRSLNPGGRWGITDDFTTSFLHFPPFSTALWDLANFRPFHSLMLPSHLFLCLPCLLPPFTAPCKTVLARPDETGGDMTIPLQFASLTIVRRSSCGPIACWILARTSSMVTSRWPAADCRATSARFTGDKQAGA